MLSEIKKLSDLNCKTSAKWCPVLLQAQRVSKLGQDAYPCTALVWLAKLKNSVSLWFKNPWVINLWITGFVLEMAVQRGTAGRNSDDDDGKCAYIMCWNLQSCVPQTSTQSSCNSYSLNPTAESSTTCLPLDSSGVTSMIFNSFVFALNRHLQLENLVFPWPCSSGPPWTVMKW